MKDIKLKDKTFRLSISEKEILEKLQGFFDSNVVVDVGFIQVTSE